MAMTPEQRKAASERMKAMQAAKKAAKAAEPQMTVNPGLGEEPQETIGVSEYNELKRQVEELKQLLGSQPAQTIQPTQDTRLVGFFEKYKMGKDYYPDMTDRLANEPRLQRFAFKENYELEFKVDDSKYTTLEGIRMVEPKFHLDLIRVVYDENTGLPTNGRYKVRRLVFHEDPDAAISIALDNGIDVNTDNEKVFLDEMRYLRQRDWLLDIFYPKPAEKMKNKKEMVIGNQVVEYYEINSEDTQAVPFGELSSKLRG